MSSRTTRPPRYDFHAHTYLTDGNTSALDMWQAADRLQHRFLAITDHVGLEDPEPLIRRLAQERRGWEEDSMGTLIGVEVTMCPPRLIEKVAREARSAGAEIVICHGETLNESVPAGTNRAAIESRQVDILAHPGLLTFEDAELAKRNGVILEISARRAHGITNGRVVQMALKAGAELVVDSDAHDPDQLVPYEGACRIAAGSGLPEERVPQVLETTPEALLKRIRSR